MSFLYIFSIFTVLFFFAGSAITVNHGKTKFERALSLVLTIGLVVTLGVLVVAFKSFLN